jgi:glycosyltransferase involved in cell wall biosynthesis
MDHPGGSEKAVIEVAHLLSSKGHQVSLLILDETGAVFFPVHQNIKIISAPLHFGNVRKGNVITRKLAFQKHVMRLRSLLERIGAETIVATEYHLTITTYLVARKLKSRIYSWEHHHFNELGKSRFWNYLLHRTYPKLDGVICLNEDEANLVKAVGAKTIVIPNSIEQKQTAGLSTRTILTVARLSAVKGIDTLLQIAKQVLQKHPGWKWKLIGDGDLKELVVSTINTEKLESQLILQQPVSGDLSKEYLESAIYVMTSRNECFPMVLLEAMSYGVPCIAFNCETGPRHIIKNNEDGILVEDQDAQAMINSIEELIASESTRKQLGTKANENIKRFSGENIYALWNDGLLKL